MVRQFYTGTRQDASIPFFEQTEQGISRRQAIMDVVSQNPGLVLSTSNMNSNLVSNPTDLSWSLEFEFSDIESFRSFMNLVNQVDSNLRQDRAAYYKQSNHTLLIEYHLEGMEERGLIAHITPDFTIIRKEDGSIVTTK